MSSKFYVGQSVWVVTHNACALANVLVREVCACLYLGVLGDKHKAVVLEEETDRSWQTILIPENEIFTSPEEAAKAVVACFSNAEKARKEAQDG